VPASHTERDWTQPYAESDAVEAGLAAGLPRPRSHWDLYQLGEELTDLEDAFRLWRFRHVTTVERVIGFKRGTGGTSGGYLRKMLDVVLFPEIWKLRTDPSADPHLSEYLPGRWQGREWLSGFTGSMGTLVVTLDAPRCSPTAATGCRPRPNSPAAASSW
jgi:hypothetical protein